ncbi:MAG TPA: ABC transporter ATP-binding protein [Polyangiaceae bacterium]|nr:ABC transporter ATP-binding protein [Polyangiaceae bacterium]
MTALELANVSVHAGPRVLLSDVSLKLAPGEAIALVGPNGAGKTTLLRTALGLLRPHSGRVLLGDVEVSRLSPRKRAAAIAWLPQHTSVSEPLSALEVVVAARYRFDETRPRSEHAARGALERVRAGALADARITELSGGERQRVSLAALLAQEARLVLLDEPASHLDPAQQLDTYRLLGELCAEGLGVLLVTHDVNLLPQLGASERVALVGLTQGRCVFRTHYGAPELLAQLGELFGVPFVEYRHEDARVLLPSPAAASSNPA